MHVSLHFLDASYVPGLYNTAPLIYFWDDSPVIEVRMNITTDRSCHSILKERGQRTSKIPARKTARQTSQDWATAGGTDETVLE